MSMKRFVKKSSRELAIVGLILAMTVIFTLIQPRFMQSSTFIDIIEQATINSFLGIGMTLAILLFVLWIPGVGLAIAWLVALIFSIIGVCRPKKGMAIAGLIITVLLLLAGIISLIFGFTLLKSLF